VLYHLFKPLAAYNVAFNVFRYVTFRTAAAFIAALTLSILLGPILIKAMKRMNAVEKIGKTLPESHREKAGTPSMGGLIILAGLIGSTLLFNNLLNRYVQLLFLSLIWLGGVGFLDDYLKNVRGLEKGLVAKYKLLGQTTLALIVGLVLLGFATAFVGLAVVLPLIGHATWHAYRETVQSEAAETA